MRKKQVLINAVMSMIQIVIIGIVIFILYKFLLVTIGVKKMGIWSLILATTSIAQIANIGFSGSVVKYVAKYTALKENQNASNVIQTATISLCVFVGFLLLFAYPAFKKILGFIVASDSLPLAIDILPYALFSFWLMVIASVLQAGLDGFQRIDLRSIILTCSSMLNLIFCVILAPSYGLMGVAYARVAQMLLTLIAMWFVLKHYIKLPFLPCKWNKQLFKEMLSYGLKYQTISIMAMFYDPITKGLLSKFGSLSMVGYYEMASRMVQQFRALLASANQVLFPAIADLKERDPEKVLSVYRTSYQVLFYLSLPLYSLLIVSLPVMSTLWIGHYEKIFISFGVLLTLGWFLNTLSAPAYFVNLGTGELGWNVGGHVVIGISNAIFGLLFGVYFGGTGVVIAWVLSLAFGSSIIYLSYHIIHKIPLIELIPKDNRNMIAVCFIFIMFSITFHIKNYYMPVILGISLSVILVTTWFHPMRVSLMRLFTDELIPKKTVIPKHNLIIF
jgi:O-antigen/teichoic acid export membrane protein